MLAPPPTARVKSQRLFDSFTNPSTCQGPYFASTLSFAPFFRSSPADQSANLVVVNNSQIKTPSDHAFRNQGILVSFSPVGSHSGSNISPTVLISLPITAALTSMAMSAAATSSSPDYSITALPAVMSQPPCVYNCLIPIELADPSGRDDVSNDCAGPSAPNDVLDVLTGCIETVCKSSTSAYAATASSLYESYCRSIYGTASFSQAFVAESSAAASSSIAAAKSASKERKQRIEYEYEHNSDSDSDSDSKSYWQELVGDVEPSLSVILIPVFCSLAFEK